MACESRVGRARRALREAEAEYRRALKGSTLAIYRAGGRVTHAADPLRAEVVAEVEREIAAVGVEGCTERPFEGE